MNNTIPHNVSFDATLAMAYQSHDNAIPSALRDALPDGEIDAHYRRFIEGVAASASLRCLDLVRSLCAWRCAPYAVQVNATILRLVSGSLMQARHRAHDAYLLHQSHSFSSSGE